MRGKTLLYGVIAICSLSFISSCTTSSLDDDDVVILDSPVSVSGDPTTTSKVFGAPGEEKKLGTIHITTTTANQNVTEVKVKLNSVAGFTHPGEVLDFCRLRLQNTEVVLAEEIARETITYQNDIVIFSLSQPLGLSIGQTTSIDVYGVVKAIPSYTYSGELFTTIQSVTTNNGQANIGQATIGNLIYIVANYPKVTSVSQPTSTLLARVKITNVGSTLMAVTQFEYFATAQIPTDIAKPATAMIPYLDTGAVTQFTIVANQKTMIDLYNANNVLAGEDSRYMVVSLNAPFINTSPFPQSGERKFQITNLGFRQYFANGTSQNMIVPDDYKPSTGLPVETSY